MIRFRVRVKNLPNNAISWYSAWSPSPTIGYSFAPVGGKRFIGIDKEYQFELAPEHEYGYLYVTCQDVTGDGTRPGNIAPPAIAPDLDAWRVYTTIKTGSYTFDWETGSLEETTWLEKNWIIALVAVAILASIGRKWKRR